MNLLLITYDYPFGIGEPFLETEISTLQQHFEDIVILSTSQNPDLTRDVPDNVTFVKCSRGFATIRCFLYALRKLVSIEFLQEVLDTRHAEHKPTLLNLVKGCMKTWAIEKRLLIKVRELGIDTAHTVAYSYWLAEGAYFIAKHKTMWSKTIARVHGYEVRDYEQYLPFRKLIDKELDEIHFISRFTEKTYERIITKMQPDCRRAKHFISRLGVVCSDFVLRKEPQLMQLEMLVVSCSSIYRLKRLDLIIEMLAGYQGSRPVRWIHFGWGELGPEIVEACKCVLENKENISYELRGWTGHSQVIDFYKKNQVSLFVNASDAEGVPVSIMEAMSFGIPCMARDVGGISEIIQHNVNGYLLPSAPSIDDMVSVLESVANGKSKLPSDVIWSWCKQHYDARDNYEKFCREVLL